MVKKASVLNNLFNHVQEVTKTELNTLRKAIGHAPTKGSASEKVWKQVLKAYLPARYEVTGGFVIDSNGNVSDQIDLVIFDKQYSALVFKQKGVTYIPAEAVFAVFEVKQTVDATHLKYTAKKIESVRKLKRTSISVAQITGRPKRKKLFPIFGGLLAIENTYRPTFGASFKKNISKYKGLSKIDLICSIDSGTYPYEINKSRVLVSLVFNLMTALQKMGNPPAIDYLAYLSN